MLDLVQVENEDLKSLLSQLSSQIKARELNEPELVRLVFELDKLLAIYLEKVKNREASDLKKTFDTYFISVDKIVRQCMEEKKSISDELVLLQRRKSAKEHYQR